MFFNAHVNQDRKYSRKLGEKQNKRQNKEKLNGSVRHFTSTRYLYNKKLSYVCWQSVAAPAFASKIINCKHHQSKKANAQIIVAVYMFVGNQKKKSIITVVSVIDCKSKIVNTAAVVINTVGYFL